MSILHTLLVALLCLLLSPSSSFQRGFVVHPRTIGGRGRRGINSLNMIVKNFDALLFDCDGVIAETERDAHRISFNQAFQLKGWKFEWDVEEYGQLLKIGGGKERMRHYFDQKGLWSTILPSLQTPGKDETTIEEEKKSLLQELHLVKTDLFRTVIDSGFVPSRPGVVRLIDDAIAKKIKIAICSTSNEAAVRTIGEVLLGPSRLPYITIFAGDVVAKKKPAPDIYLLAASTLNVDPSRCWVVEDSEIGLRAALSAGMRCCVTKSIYTESEHFENADIIVSDLDRGLDGPITINYLDYKAKPKNKTDAAVSSTGGNDNAAMFGKDLNVNDFISKMF